MPARTCKHPTCTKRLDYRNDTGYCASHRALHQQQERALVDPNSPGQCVRIGCNAPILVRPSDDAQCYNALCATHHAEECTDDATDEDCYCEIKNYENAPEADEPEAELEHTDHPEEDKQMPMFNETKQAPTTNTSSTPLRYVYEGEEELDALAQAVEAAAATYEQKAEQVIARARELRTAHARVAEAIRMTGFRRVS